MALASGRPSVVEEPLLALIGGTLGLVAALAIWAVRRKHK